MMKKSFYYIPLFIMLFGFLFAMPVAAFNKYCADESIPLYTYDKESHEKVVADSKIICDRVCQKNDLKYNGIMFHATNISDIKKCLDNYHKNDNGTLCGCDK